MTTTNTAPVSVSADPGRLRALGATDTAREIAQQPRLWRQVAASAATERKCTEAFLAPLLARADLRVVLAGAGTSAFAGQVLAGALARELGARVEAVATTDIVANPRQVFAQDVPTLLVSFARSGESPESVAATELAEQCLSEVHHLIVTCNTAGRLFTEHHGAARSLVLAMPEEADDAGFAMTSSFTCMILGTWLALSRSDPDQSAVARLADAGQQALEAWEEPARELAAGGLECVVFIGSGPLAGIAQEGALKMLELTTGAVETYFDSSLGFRHGPKAVLSKNPTVLVHLSGEEYTRAYDEDILEEVRAVVGVDRVIAVSALSTPRTQAGPSWTAEGLEGLPDVLTGVVMVIGAQLLGLHLSLALGRTPDNPFPDGEVNRVVQGVTVHPLPAADRR